MFLYSRLVSIKRLRAYVAVHAGAKGISRLRRVVELAEPKTESAMETRLRMLLVLAGLPRPQAQVPLCDNEGRWLGRPDLLYRDQRLAIEYDGGNHRERLVDDDRRQNRLIGSGLRILRFTAADVYGAPESVVADVRRALAARASDEQTS
jgi:very-short-patch-repair endonuclease